jgi:hypothetical protein
LDLPFARNKSLVDAVSGQDLITFTRASGGTFVNSAGQIEIVAANVPRFTHDPVTGESLGLLPEEQRTNSIRNNTMVGAVAGTPGTLPTNWLFASAAGGLTREIVGVGSESGISYIDIRYFGTTTNANGCEIAPGNGAALTGQTWAGSTYWKLVGGSSAGASSFNIGLIEETSEGGFVGGAFYSQTAPTSAPLISQRPAAIRTLSGGATVARLRHTIQIAIPTATAIDITLRIGLPQLEQGAFATSVIPTSGTAVTRSADVASITGDNFSRWYRQDEGTVLASTVISVPKKSTTFSAAASFNDGTINNRILIVVNSDSSNNFYGVFAASGNATQANANTGVVDSATSASIALAYQVDNIGYSLNGLNTVLDTSASIPTVDRLEIGLGLQRLNGTIRRLCFFPQRLPNSTLQNITL